MLRVAQHLLTVAAMVAAGISAWLWWRASKVPIPPATGDDWDGRGPFADALAKQSKLNARGALWAAIAVSLQGLAILVGAF
jgi:hypothetical protein